MANVLISYSGIYMEGGDCKLYVFAEGLVRSLINCGNKVKYIPTSHFLNTPWHGNNKIKKGINAKKLLDDVKSFKPDLIIAFNHSIPRIILDNIDCPLAVWDADSFQYFNDRDYIKENIDRYKFMCFSQAGIDNVRRFGAPEENITLMEAATALKAEEKPIAHNISFIGTYFKVRTIEKLFRYDTPANAGTVIKELNENFYGDNINILKKYNAEWMLKHWDLTTLMSVKSFNDRNEILNEVKELGLAIYGNAGWYELAHTLLYLSFCYDPRQVYSLKHNQDIYNASNLCISISHNHAVDGYPWRVLDIMATNGCLVANQSSGIQKLTKGYVDIPMYRDRHEALDICKSLLQDEPRRRAVAQASQACIEERGRWEDRFKEISSFMGVDIDSQPKNIIADDEDIPQSVFYKAQDYQFFKELRGVILPKCDMQAVYIRASMPTFVYHILRKLMGRI